MKLKHISGLLITSLCLLLIAFSYLTRRPLCIDSRLVDKIDRVGIGGTATIYRCNYVQHVDYDEKFANEAPGLNIRLKRLEGLFDWSNNKKSAVDILVLENEQNIFKVDEGKIILSEDVYSAPGQLEKALVMQKIRSSDNFVVNDMAESLLTHFILDVSLGLNPKEIHSHEDFNLSLRGLTPNFSRSLKDSYNQLTSEQKILLTKSLFYNLGSLHWQTKSNNQDVYSLITDLTNLILQGKNDNPSLSTKIAIKTFISNFQNQLSNHGVDESSNNLILDTIFIFDKNLKETTKIFLEKNSFSESNLSIGVINGANFWLMPENKKPFSIEKTPEYKALRGVYISCNLPSTEQLLSYADKIQKLLVISDCTNVTALKFDNYLKIGIKGFAIDNKNKSFVQIHLPSMNMAMQKDSSIINPLSLILTKNWSNKFFNKVGWQDPVYDEMTGAFKANSSIEVVDWFR